MAISIRNPRVEELARDLARRKAALAEIVAECAALPDLDERSPEDILGYGSSEEYSDGDR